MWWVLQVDGNRKKQPCADVLQNRCSEKFRNIHRKTLVLGSLFNNVEDLKLYETEEESLSCRDNSVLVYKINL